MDRRRSTGRCMAILGLGVLAASVSLGAGAAPALDRRSAAVRDNSRTPTTGSPSTPSTTGPSRAQTRTQIDLPTTSTTLNGPVSRTPASPPGAAPSKPGSGEAPHPTPTTAVAPGTAEAGPAREPVPPALGEVAPTTTTTAVSDAVVGEIGQDRGAKPGPAMEPAPKRTARALSRTGAPVRSLLILAGVTLLLGALAVAFGEPNAVPVTAGRGTGTVPGRRSRRVRRTIRGWESGVPLAPEHRERVRQRIQRRQWRP
jgi:hypothetical protein